MDRAVALEMDRRDPLAGFRSRFDIDQEAAVYMDGNSLGRPPRAVLEAIRAGAEEWARELVGGWDRWIDLPAEVGDRLGGLIGASPGQVLVCDSTTVNIYKLAWAALAARPDRDVIVADESEFPTDRYVLEGLARSAQRVVRQVPAGDAAGEGTERVLAAIDENCALVCLSQVNYRSGTRFDVPAITERAHRCGALVLWDLAHSAGALPIDLDGWGVDLAAGCTYKYLNAGPGAPGFLYVARELQAQLRQPIWGWFGQADQFQMGPGYRPAPGVGSFLTGTPGILALNGVAASLRIVEEAGIPALWEKSEQLTAVLTELVEERLLPLGARLASPRSPAERGAHVSVAHPEAWAWCRTLIGRNLVIPDFRAPNVIRLGPAPLYTRFVDCFDTVERMETAMRTGLDPAPATRVT